MSDQSAPAAPSVADDPAAGGPNTEAHAEIVKQAEAGARFALACSALTGLLANGKCNHCKPGEIGTMAVEAADATLAALV